MRLDQEAACVRLGLAGASVAEIAGAVGVREEEVRRVLIANGWGKP